MTNLGMNCFCACPEMFQQQRIRGTPSEAATISRSSREDGAVPRQRHGAVQSAGQAQDLPVGRSCRSGNTHQHVPSAGQGLPILHPFMCHSAIVSHAISRVSCWQQLPRNEVGRHEEYARCREVCPASRRSWQQRWSWDVEQHQ